MTTDYLAGYKSEAALASFDGYAGQIEKLKFRIPSVDEVNLRTETDQFNLSRQEYALRVMFNNWTAQKYYAREKEGWSQRVEAEKLLFSAGIIFNRYLELNELHYLEMLIPAYQTDSIFADSLLRIAVAEVSQGEKSDVNDIVDWEFKTKDIAEKINALRASVKIVKNTMGVDDADVSWEFWPSPAFMDSLLNTINVSSSGNAQKMKFRADSLLMHNRWEISKRNDNRIVDYAQLRYSRRDNLLFQDEFSIGMGFRIPFKGTQIKQSNDNRLDWYDLQHEQNLSFAESMQALREEYKKFKMLLVQWQSLSNSGGGYSAINLENPFVRQRLNLEKDKRKNEEQFKKLELEKKLTDVYISFLFLAGEMEKRPGTDYLSSLLPRF